MNRFLSFDKNFGKNIVWTKCVCFGKVYDSDEIDCVWRFYMRNREKERLGDKQQLIMQCIWDMGGEGIKQDIIDMLATKYGIHMTRQAINISTQALIEKGYLAVTNKVANAYVFTALISQEEFQMAEIKRVKKMTFGGSARMMVQALFEEGDITQEEVDAIKEMIEKHNG